MPLFWTPETFLTDVHRAAVDAAHPFPTITACEAAFETDFGACGIAVFAKNVFRLYPSVDFPIDFPRIKLHVESYDAKRGRPAFSMGYWPSFPTLQDCLAVRLQFLHFRAKWDAGIAEALRVAETQAANPAEDLSAEYITALSKNIVGPSDRAELVLSIAQEFASLFSSDHYAVDKPTS